MPRYVIERQYLLPVYEHLLIEAADLEAACCEAIDEIGHPWSDHAREDFDSARPTTITAAVQLPDGTYPELKASDEGEPASLGNILYHAVLDLLPIPTEFTEEAKAERAVGQAVMTEGEGVGFT